MAKVYCGDECRDVAGELRRTEIGVCRLVDSLRSECTESNRIAMAAVRARLFRVANMVNALGPLAQAAKPSTRKQRGGWRGLTRGATT